MACASLWGSLLRGCAAFGTRFGCMGRPDHISTTAVYAASSDSKYMTGEALLVSGSLT